MVAVWTRAIGPRTRVHTAAVANTTEDNPTTMAVGALNAVTRHALRAPNMAMTNMPAIAPSRTDLTAKSILRVLSLVAAHMHPAAKLNFAFGPSMTSSSCVIAAAHTARSDGKSAAQRRIMPSDSAFHSASLTSSPSQLLLP